MQLTINPYTMTNEQLRQTAVFLLTIAGDEVVIPLPANTPPHPRKAIPVDVPPPPVIPVPNLPAENFTPYCAPVSSVPAPAPLLSSVSAPAPLLSSVSAPVPAVPAPITSERPSVINPFAPAKPNGVEVDVTGLPWDSRIHSRTKSKTNDGKWKIMRGIDPNVLTQVEQELRNVMAIPAAPIAPVVPAPSVPVPPFEIEEIYEHPPLSNDESQMDFPNLVTKVQTAISGNKLSSAQLADIVKDCGLPSLAILSTRPGLSH